MIVWIASYPRSGNTLLRTILKQTMGLHSYGEEEIPVALRISESTEEITGALPSKRSIQEFYAHACNSNELFLIKTHLPPIDSHKAIYVVRDGRLSTESYAAYQRAFLPGNPPPSILELMLGDDYYGNWSSHYQEWVGEGRENVLLVRFEELVNADDHLLRRLSDFIGHDGKCRPFENPLPKLHADNPDFFRKGETKWNRERKWSGALEALFICVHGELLMKLGYIDVADYEAASSALSPLERDLGKLASRAFKEKRDWLRAAEQKEKVIQNFLKR